MEEIKELNTLEVASALLSTNKSERTSMIRQILPVSEKAEIDDLIHNPETPENPAPVCKKPLC